ncbi:hypothetical protein GLOIN_2v1783204 [Rhizophagus clarus]|uniref:C2H2-type domain-containing protein n=1 Tax=Rhizophagus clarus TaxID=94130 RepID=A0A8H3KMW7_9GLOM|nr:hypothetical protein GLOIN_2v1783204 [Rhizophagus clarus]
MDIVARLPDLECCQPSWTNRTWEMLPAFLDEPDLGILPAFLDEPDLGILLDSGLEMSNYVFRTCNEKFSSYWSPFDDIIFPGSVKESDNKLDVPWQWLENHTKICQYSLVIKKCEDSSYCSPKHYEEAAILFAENNGLLPPVTKGKDGHFLNPLCILEYCNKLKIPGYDAHCSSINENTYSRLCCSECNAYFPTLSIVAKHKKNQHPK